MLPPIQQKMADTPIPICEGTPSYKPPVKQAFAQDKIGAFCNHVDGFVVDSKDNTYGPVAYGIDGKDSDGLLWLSVSWDPSCNPVAPGKATVVKDDCSLKMSAVLNGCNTNSIDTKWGGQAWSGCILWNMTTTLDNSDIPPNMRGTRSSAPSRRSRLFRKSWWW
jgi:hypothetical protein